MIKYQRVVVITALVCFISGFISVVYFGKLRGIIPFVAMGGKWSIGIYIGESPVNFAPPETISNPVLTNMDVKDVPADFVADPFMVKEISTWYMFFEVMNTRTNQGDIGLAISNDGLNWHYKQIVLDEPFHLSYPYVFKWKNEYYMIPESNKVYSIRLYKAVDFPTRWSFVATLLDGSRYRDSSIFYFNDKWWLFSATANDTLRLYYANELMSPWLEHPSSPVIAGDANIARPGGRVVLFNDRIIRYTQDDDPIYGNQVRAFEITELTTVSYKEKEVAESPIVKASGTGWNAEGMHHIDPHQIDENRWIACVDGYRKSLTLGFNY